MADIICPKCSNVNKPDAKFCTSCGENLSGLGDEGNVTLTAKKDTCIGQVLDGKYMVMDHIGDGGMGTVYKAEQLTLNKIVAIKILHKNLLQDDVQVKRFQREAWSASRLEHPHSIQILDFGQTPEGSHYIAMEFLKGEELSDVIRNGFPLPEKRIVNVLSQVCSVLSEAHAHKIIHRDLKPENIVLIERAEEKDFVKVLDFGIAKLQERDPSRPALTMQGIVCGTPEYMSPEQAMGKDLDPRTDIYSIGCILYEMLTGSVPYEANTYQAILSMHIQGDLISPSELKPDVVSADSPLEQVCIKAMAKNKEDRYESAMDLKRALEQALKGSVDAETAAFSGQTPKVPSTSLAYSASTGSKSGSGVGIIVGALIVVALLLVGAAYIIFSDDKGDSEGQQKLASKVETEAPVIKQAEKKEEAAIEEEGKQEKKAIPRKPLVMAGMRKNNLPEINNRSKADMEKMESRGEKNGFKKPKIEMTPEQRQKTALKYYEKGNRALLSQKNQEAIKWYKRSKTLNPNSPPVYKKLGMAYMNVGKNEIAKGYFDKYLRLSPKAADARHIKKIMNSL